MEEYRHDKSNKSKDVLIEAIADFLVQNLEVLNSLNISAPESRSESEENKKNFENRNFALKTTEAFTSRTHNNPETW